MIQVIYSIIFGALQGVTEFLPISSSGHLIILHNFFELDIDNLIFDVALHFGTLLALLVYFRSVLYRMFSGFFGDVETRKDKQQLKFLGSILVATIPAVFVGLMFEDVVKLYFRNIMSVSWMLVLGGALLIAFDKIGTKDRKFINLDPFEILLIGIAQAFAIIPGVSRSGATIIAGLGLKLQRKQSAEFSFLLSIPIVLGAAIKKFFDLNLSALSNIDIWVLIVGIISSFLVGYLVVKYFIKFLEKYSLSWFGWYRVVLGGVALVWIYLS